MSNVLGFYSSEYSEPRANLRSLGGPPFTLIEDPNTVFNEVPEYGSTNVYEDFRVIYIVNTSPAVVIIESSFLNIEYNWSPHSAKATLPYSSLIRINMFNPTYAFTKYIHPTINSDGTFKGSEVDIKNVIRTEATRVNYGKNIVVPTKIGRGEFFPIILHRIVSGPLPYIRDFSFKIKSFYAVE